MLKITDPALIRQVLEHFIERVENGGLEELLKAGVDPEALDVLRQRSARDLVRASKMDKVDVLVSFDGTALLRCFDRLDAIKRDTELKEYFVKHGASPEMLADLFKCPADEVRRLRDLLTPGIPPGRPKLPPPAVRDRIHQDWAQLTKTVGPLRERLFKLHQLHQELTILSLWSTLHEFHEPVPARRPAT